MAISAPNDSSLSVLGGSVYIYNILNAATSPTFKLCQVLYSPQSPVAPLSLFGNNLFFSNTTGLVSSYTRASTGAETACVYVYRLNSDDADNAGEWSLVTTLFSNSPSSEDSFGQALAIYANNVVVVGAPAYKSSTLNSQGTVYIFYNKPEGSWIQSKKLNGASAYDHFGSAVLVLSDSLYIGAKSACIDTFTGAGSVYVFGDAFENLNIEPTTDQTEPKTVFDHIADNLALILGLALPGGLMVAVFLAWNFNEMVSYARHRFQRSYSSMQPSFTGVLESPTPTRFTFNLFGRVHKVSANTPDASKTSRSKTLGQIIGDDFVSDNVSVYDDSSERKHSPPRQAGIPVLLSLVDSFLIFATLFTSCRFSAGIQHLCRGQYQSQL